ncbi:MAG: ferrous iron transporter B [Candidatus Caldarchaeum sp.]|nr:ferrous iron transporter B [Candidatus Caldarchaeum sp.]
MPPVLRYAITGPPNVGKSSLFVALTGIHVKTANIPGTTIEIHRGKVGHGLTDVEVTDLPGIMRPEAPLDDDEKTAVDEITKGSYDGVVVVAAPHAWNEALRLAKFAARYRPVLLVFNMVDMWKPPYSEPELSEKVSTPVLYTSAVKGFGIKKLAETLSRGVQFSTPKDFEMEVPRSTVSLSKLFLNPVLALALVSLIAFASVLLLVSLVEGITPWGKLPFSVIPSLEAIETSVAESIYSSTEDQVFASFLADGIWGSVMTLASISVYVFVALVLVVLYEESGLVAFFSRGIEKVLLKVGVPPRGAVCLLMGVSCNVPALAGARILWGRGNRIITALLVPFMPCAARLAIFASVATAALAMHPHLVPLMIFLPYVVSLIAVIPVSLLYRKAFRTEPTPAGYIPNAPLMLPKFRIYVLKLFIEFKEFLKKVGPALLLFLILLWPFKAFGFGGFTDDISQSFIAQTGKLLDPLFAPMELPWQVSASLLSGWIFKETVLGVLDSTGGLTIMSSLSIPSIAAYLVFVAFYSACIATLLYVRKIVGLRATVFSMAVNLSTAYLTASATYHILSAVL